MARGRTGPAAREPRRGAGARNGHRPRVDRLSVVPRTAIRSNPAGRSAGLAGSLFGVDRLPALATGASDARRKQQRGECARPERAGPEHEEADAVTELARDRQMRPGYVGQFGRVDDREEHDRGHGCGEEGWPKHGTDTTDARGEQVGVVVIVDRTAVVGFHGLPEAPSAEELDDCCARTHASTRRTRSLPRISPHAGILPLRPLRTVVLMSSRVPPYSQMLSVRFGAPSAMLPLPSGPWQAAQIVT